MSQWVYSSQGKQLSKNEFEEDLIRYDERESKSQMHKSTVKETEISDLEILSCNSENDDNDDVVIIQDSPFGRRGKYRTRKYQF